VSSNTFVAFDVETTGLVAGVDRVVEMAAVVFAGDEVRESFSSLVNPGVSMPAAVTRVTGITDEMLAGAPAPLAPLTDFLQILHRGTPVAHNAVFDVGFVLSEAQEAGLPMPDGPVLDTRGIARKAFPGRFSYGLGNLVKDLGLETAGAHRALADAHACRSLFHACCERLSPGALPAQEDLVRFSGAPLDFRDHAPRQPGIARLMKAAIDAGGAVQITYHSSDGETTERMIMPLAITCIGGAPAVTAFCTLRNENRTFFLGSIQDARAP
jgi:DNA polymerase-3 subunit epsilon